MNSTPSASAHYVYLITPQIQPKSIHEFSQEFMLMISPCFLNTVKAETFGMWKNRHFGSEAFSVSLRLDIVCVRILIDFQGFKMLGCVLI